MKKLYSYLTLALVLLLVGCGHRPPKPEVQVVYETKIVLLEPPAKFYAVVPLIAPPEKELYRDMTCQARENALTDLYIKQNTQLRLANQNAKDLGDWINKQKDILTKPDDKKK